MAQHKSLVSAIEDATDKNQLTEDWGRIAAVCEIVSKNPSENGRQAVDILINQLVDSPNGNVQRYTLTLLNAVVQDSGLIVMYYRPEFTWGELRKLGSSPRTHATVRERLLDILEDWKSLETDSSFKDGPEHTLKAILQVYPHLRAQKTSTSVKSAPAAPVADDEDEDLKRALALSLEESQRQTNMAQNAPQGQSVQQISHVKALYDLSATGPGELSFRAGDIIEVLDDKMHKDWWKGRANNSEGIFPTNYVEPCAAPAQSSVPAQVAEEEYIFAQSRNVEKLLSIFATASRHPDMNVINNPDVQRMYNELMAMHPRITQLIAEYQAKKADLMNVNDQISAVRQRYQEMAEQGEQAAIADHAESQRQAEAQRLAEMQKQFEERQNEAARVQQQLEAEYRARLQAPETLSLPYNVNGHMTHPLAAQFPPAYPYGYQPSQPQAQPQPQPSQPPQPQLPQTSGGIPNGSQPSVSAQAVLPQTSGGQVAGYPPSVPAQVPVMPQVSGGQVPGYPPSVPAALSPMPAAPSVPPSSTPLHAVPQPPSVPPAPSAYPYQAYQAYPQ